MTMPVILIVLAIILFWVMLVAGIMLIKSFTGYRVKFTPSEYRLIYRALSLLDNSNIELTEREEKTLDDLMAKLED